MRCLLFACLLLGSLPAFALDRFQVEGYALPNGLQLLLKPGTERGHVAIRLVVGVGLDDFDCDDKELPHLLEHLLFSGIDASGEGDAARARHASAMPATVGRSPDSTPSTWSSSSLASPPSSSPR